MGIRVEVRFGESIEQAVKRFRAMVWRYGSPGAGRKRPKWHKRQLDHYLKPSELRRRDTLRDEWQTFVGECNRRHLVTSFRRGRKRHKAHFGDSPIVGRYP
jgi:ribosomal protein S21